MPQSAAAVFGLADALLRNVCSLDDTAALGFHYTEMEQGVAPPPPQ